MGNLKFSGGAPAFAFTDASSLFVAAPTPTETPEKLRPMPDRIRTSGLRCR